MVEFKDRLRALRQLRNLSVGQLAERTGVPKATLARWDNGESSPSVGSKHLASIAEFFDMSLAELIGGAQ